MYHRRGASVSPPTGGGYIHTAAMLNQFYANLTFSDHHQAKGISYTRPRVAGVIRHYPSRPVQTPLVNANPAMHCGSEINMLQQ